MPLTELASEFVYPIFLDLRDRLTVVVGAGQVGQRKLQGLLKAGAKVRLIDPLLAKTPCLETAVEAVGRCFRASDLQDARLVFACTDSPQVNQQVVDEARRRQVLCCRADRPWVGDFALPAVYTQGGLRVAVSTSGKSPALAVEMRDRLEQLIPDFWGVSLEIMAGIRRIMLTDKVGNKYNQRVLRHFWADQLLPLLELRRFSEIDELLIETFGSEFSLEHLQVQIPEGIS